MKTLSKLLMVLSFFWILPSVFSGNVFAQETIPLVVSPAKQEVLLNKGEQKILGITVFNKGTKIISGRLTTSDFIVKETDGTPSFIENSPYPEISAHSWITTDNDLITIQPQSSSIIPLTINVPSDAKAGGHYVAFLFEPQITSQEGSTNISVRVASLLSIRVNGTIAENAQLSMFSAPFLIEMGPIPVKFSVSNQGDYHIVPKGNVSLATIFGSTISGFPVRKLNIFPNGTRNYNASLGKNLLLGPYKIELELKYGEKLKSLHQTAWVFAFPWKLFLIVLLGLAILYYMRKSLRTKHHANSDSDRTYTESLREFKKTLKKRDA